MWHKCWLLAMILTVVMAFSACSGCHTVVIVEPSSEVLVETEQDQSSREKETATKESADEENHQVTEQNSEIILENEVIATTESNDDEHEEEHFETKCSASSDTAKFESSALPQTSATEPASQPATKPTEADPVVQPTETQPPETTAAPHVHSYTGEVTKQPTCRETGVRTYTCSCGDTYTETIPKTDHHYVEKKEETVVTVSDSEAFTEEIACCIPRYFTSYSQNENGTWNYVGTWQDTVVYGVPQQQYFYEVSSNYRYPDGHNSSELLAYMRSAGYPYLYEDMQLAAEACGRWLRCVGEFSDGPKNPDHGFRNHYGPNWWEEFITITVPAVTHQETVTNTYYECSECGHRK